MTRNIAYLDAVVADPELSLADALAIAGVPLDGLQAMYRASTLTPARRRGRCATVADRFDSAAVGKMPAATAEVA